MVVPIHTKFLVASSQYNLIKVSQCDDIFTRIYFLVLLWLLPVNMIKYVVNRYVGF